MRFLFLFFLFLIGCQKKESSPSLFSGHVMTIDYHIWIGDRLDKEQILCIDRLIEETFYEIDRTYNKWNPHSEISRINHLPAHVWMPLSPSLYSFLEQVQAFVLLSEGLFDPTVEPLQKVWKGRMEEGVLPSPEELQAIQSCVGWTNLQLKEGAILKKNEKTALDLGGIAKGLCVDLLIEKLQQQGIHHAFVEWGGEIKAIGRHPSGRKWKAYVSCLDNPDPQAAIAQIELENQAIATSGDYFQSWTIGSKTYCHVFNPQTLSPLEVKIGSVASATLLADTCVKADALAKVLMLFEKSEEAEAWIEELKKKDPSLNYWIACRAPLSVEKEETTGNPL